MQPAQSQTCALVSLLSDSLYLSGSVAERRLAHEERFCWGDVILGDEVKSYDYGKRYSDGFRHIESSSYNTSNFNRDVRGLLNFLGRDRGMR